MIYDYFGGIRYPLKQGLALEFCRNKHKVTSILTQTHINHDQIHHIKNNWRLLVLLDLGLWCITEIDTDPKGRFLFFKATPYDDRALGSYAPSGCSTKEKLVRGTFLWRDTKLHRLHSKTKFGKDPWYFNNSLLCRPEFSSATKTLPFY